MDNNKTTFSHEELWRATLGEIEIQISKANFNTWFKNTTILAIENGVAMIGVPNIFNKEWLERKYTDSILKSLRRLGAEAREVRYLVQAVPPASRGLTPGRLLTESAGQSNGLVRKIFSSQQLELTKTNGAAGLNDRYQFENFIVGPFNELAHAAAQAVAQQPGKKFNPLFIYGGVGLGKTHLLQSIGNFIGRTNPRARVVYCNSEAFTRELVRSFKNQAVEDFKNRFRSVDILIIDDIQFIAGKEKTQEELFHTFNHLYEAGRQIIFSADKPPKAIPMLEGRLRSRFEGGMPVDISFPDFETRLAILQYKLEEKSALLPEPVIEMIAHKITRNIRELEGALNKIVSYFELAGPVSDLKKLEAMIADFGAAPEQTTSFKTIIEHVARYFDLPPGEVLKRTRKKEVVVPRQIVMYLLRHELNYSFPAIGRRLGGKDHTTVMYACKKIEDLLVKSAQLKNDVEVIKERLYNYA